MERGSKIKKGKRSWDWCLCSIRSPPGREVSLSLEPSAALLKPIYQTRESKSCPWYVDKRCPAQISPILGL